MKTKNGCGDIGRTSRSEAYDPYSNSKACSELVTSSYRSSYFNPERLCRSRCGNRIRPGRQCYRRRGLGIGPAYSGLHHGRFSKGEKVLIRNPHAIRPWQHVLEPLSGYLELAQKLYEDGPQYIGRWNFGPDDSDAKPVEWIVQDALHKMGLSRHHMRSTKATHPHEAHYLKLDCSKAKTDLGWHPRWGLTRP